MQTKHTPGPWVVTDIQRGHGFDMGYPMPHRLIADCGCVSVVTQQTGNIALREHSEANARLIAEAGTVASETGLTPRQLAEQRQELITALKELTDIARTFRNVPKSEQNWGQLDDEVLEQAFAAIAKAEGGAR